MPSCYTPAVDPYREQIGAYAVGALEAGDSARLEEHLEAGCAACSAELDRHRDVIRRLSPSLAPDPSVRQQVLDLSQAPYVPPDLTAFSWQEPYPGFRIAAVKEYPSRGVKAILFWAKPGARYPAHRHGGHENCLVLQGGFRDEESRYGLGEIAHRRPGSVHAVEILPGEDCICYVVSYGDIEVVGTLD